MITDSPLLYYDNSKACRVFHHMKPGKSSLAVHGTCATYQKLRSLIRSAVDPCSPLRGQEF